MWNLGNLKLLGEAELIQMRKTTELPSELLLNQLNLLSSVFVTDLNGFVCARERPRCWKPAIASLLLRMTFCETSQYNNDQDVNASESVLGSDEIAEQWLLPLCQAFSQLSRMSHRMTWWEFLNIRQFAGGMCKYRCRHMVFGELVLVAASLRLESFMRLLWEAGASSEHEAYRLTI